MKYIKRILLLFVLLLPIIVFSKESALEDVVIKEISGDASAGNFRLEDGTFIPNITFKSIGDSVIYQLFLKHDSSLYELDKINDNNQNPFIQTNYSVVDDKVFLMVKYDQEVTGDFSLNSIQMNAKLKEKNVNPKTGFPIYFYCLIILLLLIVGYFIFKKKKGFIFLILLFPLIVYAKDNSLELNISMEDIKIAYNVQFYKGDGVNGTIEEIECIYGSVCNLPVNSFQKEGNAFKGWSLEPGGEILYLDEDEVLNLASSGKVVLYPVWKREYTISFNGNGSTSGSMSNIICIEGESCSLTSNAYQRTNYLFSGWATSSNGEVLYIDEEEITVENSLNLYAIWSTFVSNFDYTGSVQNYIVPQSGRYKLEVWGAQGGSYSSQYYGGKGGYSTGIVNLNKGTRLYVYSGGAGGSVTTNYQGGTGGFNGGGQGGDGTNLTSGYIGAGGSGGGGASDIRIGQDSLYARVIVAGGGGGTGGYNSYTFSPIAHPGGYGGGQTGETPLTNSASTGGTTTSNPGAGGGASSAGAGGATPTFTSSGSDGTYHGSGGGGGGAGWYGGGGGSSGICSGSAGAFKSPGNSGDFGSGGDGGSNSSTSTYHSVAGGNGGGGSGYVYTSSTASNYPSDCLLNSSYYLTDASTTAGSSSFTSPSGSSETGHAGNGYARITYLGN